MERDKNPGVSGEGKQTLAELLETDLLKCPGCSEQFTSPLLLPCLHSLCADCVQDLSRSKIHESDNSNQELQNQNCDSKDIKSSHMGNSTLKKSNLGTKPTTTQNSSNGKSCDLQTTDGGEGTSSEDQEFGQVFQCPICASSINTQIFPVNNFLKHLVELYTYKNGPTPVCDYCAFTGKSTPATALCLDCHDHICDSCSDAHRRTKVTRSHQVAPYKQIKMGMYDHDIRAHQLPLCINHTQENVTLFCDKCEEVVCSQCMSSGHKGHSTCSVESAVPRYKLAMQGLIRGLVKQIPSISKYCKFLASISTSVEEAKLKLFSDLENQANTLHTMIDEHKNQTMERVASTCAQEICLLEDKISGLERAQLSLGDNANYLECLLVHGQGEELLSLHHLVTHRLTQLTHLELDGINSKLRLNFTPTCPTKAAVSTMFGSLSLGHVPLNSDETVSMATNLSSTLLPSVKNTPPTTLTFSTKCDDDIKDVWPTGVAITKDNSIVIADRDNKNIKIFSSNGERKLVFCGEGEGKIGTPFDLTVLTNSNIAVTDRECEDVKVFTQTGKYVFSIKGHFRNPRGITTNNKGQIIVVDCQKLQLTVHDPKDGSLLNTITARNKDGTNALVDPFYVSVNSLGNILVTDTAAPNIKVFSPQGAYLSQQGTYGTRDNQTLQPYGVCCDRYGYLFVADNNNDRILLLKPDGQFQRPLLTQADGLWHPMALTTTNDTLVVTEALGQVKVYRYV
ncbi:tripartite motif-containing protein 3-like [Pecten maximus]|uniref:tripartite motif-containing protein 3-like n=1 Tax=Pecten maximus TaxID=6579 RepID=UPI001458FD3F|nr:tripartite motif-containing protein 3-like [Pecten maximus]